MLQDECDAVRRRRVFYVPGYDPFPARRYRELYRKESAKQAAISGYMIEQFTSVRSPRDSWNVKATMEGRETETTITVLSWSDIVRSSMASSIPATYSALFRTAWLYLRSGVLFRLVRTRKGPVIAALYPVVVLMLQGAAAVCAGWWTGEMMSALHLGFSLLMGLAAFGLVLYGFRALDRWLFVHYLLLDYAFSAQCDGAYPESLKARVAEFRQSVVGAISGGYDEVLIVGHSSGAHIAISLLAGLLRENAVPGGRPALSLLTLGHVVPMVSFLPNARELRRDLHEMAAQNRIAWVDVSAPGDGCCFALCDPVSVTGVAPPEKRWPLVLSAAFTQTLSPERRKALRWRFFRLHFQYLCAFDRPGVYDYFRATAGPKTLRARFAGLRPSASRLEKPLSFALDMAS